MGAGLGHNCLSITNHANKAIDITTIADSSVAEGERRKTITIGANDSHLIFMDRVEALSWERSK